MFVAQVVMLPRKPPGQIFNAAATAGAATGTDRE
jgi:hypothetical protein